MLIVKGMLLVIFLTFNVEYAAMGWAKKQPPEHLCKSESAMANIVILKSLKSIL